MHMTTLFVGLALVFLIVVIIRRVASKSEWQKQETTGWLITGVVVLVLVLALTIAPAQIGYMEKGEGEQSGYITAIESGGIFHKTTTVYIKTDRESSAHETYCATDPDLIEQLKDHRDNNQRVTISYTQHVLWGKGCEWDSGYKQVIHSVRPT